MESLNDLMWNDKGILCDGIGGMPGLRLELCIYLSCTVIGGGTPNDPAMVMFSCFGGGGSAPLSSSAC